MKRSEFLAYLRDAISKVERPHTVRVGINGIDASGKTTLGDELGTALRNDGYSVIRASIDDYYLPCKFDKKSPTPLPEQLYDHVIDYVTLEKTLLNPLGPEGDARYRLSTPDNGTCSLTLSEHIAVSEKSVLVFDGVFIFRSRLIKHWDYKVFLDVASSVAENRIVARDIRHYPDESAARNMFANVMLAANHLYLQETDPRGLADMVVDNNHPETPAVYLK